ncbi:hypothetical protein, partial [Aestuariivirga sp.]|uniref:hypothetical protein n=1 Tax=Aestuariivirga sp. TaxID=2650926 RepID=UPI0037846918
MNSKVAFDLFAGMPCARLPESEFEELLSKALPGNALRVPQTPMAVAFLASCVRFSGRPAYRIDGQWITWADCARRVGLLAARIIKDIRRPD